LDKANLLSTDEIVEQSYDYSEGRWFSYDCICGGGSMIVEKVSKLVTEHIKLQYALASMLEQADADCPSEYRTKWFRESMNEGYALLKKVGFFRMINKKQKEVA
jgi:hypothetical protein